MNEHYPKAYKDGICDFYGRDFLVDERVLIPRPETEMIIDAVLSLTGKAYLPGVKPSKAVLPQDLTIVDVGTGSGCIAITLKLELPDSNIYAVDISEYALRCIKKNTKKFGINGKIKIFFSDLLSNPVFDEARAVELNAEFKQRKMPIRIPNLSNFDVVVANLPYVDRTWDWLDMERLKYEPEIALFAEKHGLALIFKLIKQVSKSKAKYLILEADPCQHEAIKKYASSFGLKHIETRGFILEFYLSLE